jgi:hypothetical protein
MVNLCSECFTRTTRVKVAVGNSGLVFGIVIDIVSDQECECPCHQGNTCVISRRLNGRAVPQLESPGFA